MLFYDSSIKYFNFIIYVARHGSRTRVSVHIIKTSYETDRYEWNSLKKSQFEIDFINVLFTGFHV